ncbi:kelch repeat-containing protein [Candidatus Cyanaurora vandensis]|uniref:Kelch repeat-containing protein n=1 Tax=Candidatus Cyanaurora vandensis TaxID=2714958 RepID=UPI00257BEDA6|nr:kelch repeat-containing protein [Candidatus Cyanaurora vandensis]
MVRTDTHNQVVMVSKGWWAVGLLWMMPVLAQDFCPGPPPLDKTIALVPATGLSYSTDAGRTNPISLSGATVAGKVYVFTTPTTDTSRVEFFLNDPDFSDNPLRTETAAPFDYAGSASNGNANALDTITLTDGSHTVTARTTLTGGTTEAIDGTFTVNNGLPQGFTRFTWKNWTAAPLTRSEAQGGVIDGKLYVFGGYPDSRFIPTTRADRYDPVTNTWQQIADMPKPTTHGGFTADERHAYIVGGYQGKPGGQGGQTFSTREGWKYNIETNTWTALPLLPLARGSGGLVLLGRTLHFFGGVDGQRIDKGDHWILSVDGGTAWTRAVALPNPRSHLGSVALGGLIYAIGGQKSYDNYAITQPTVHVWDPANPGLWSPRASLPKPLSHIGGSTFVVGNRILVLGGEIAHSSAVADTWAYDPTRDQWLSLTPLTTPRYSGIAGVINNQIYYTTGTLKANTYRGTPQP